MLYITFRSGSRPEDTRVLAVTADPDVVRAALRALTDRLWDGRVIEFDGLTDESNEPEDEGAEPQEVARA